MPQVDRHYPREVPIEFNYNEEFEESIIEDRLRLILITNGNATLQINTKTVSVTAPTALCLSQGDSIKVLNRHRLAAKSFMFHPKFLNPKFTFDLLKENKFPTWQDKHDKSAIHFFLHRNEKFSGNLSIPPAMYLTVNQWFGVVGTETYAQSDGHWTCRIRRYLLQILYVLQDLYAKLRTNEFNVDVEPENNYVNIALEYIHTNYNQDISLDTLCKVCGLNRTSLNKKFKEKTGYTMIEYLINHRIKIACETLVNTGLKLTEIAEACGFVYVTYFNKQFTKRVGVSPANYRKNAQCTA